MTAKQSKYWAMLSKKFDQFHIWLNKTQRRSTALNRVFKCAQLVELNMLRAGTMVKFSAFAHCLIMELAHSLVLHEFKLSNKSLYRYDLFFQYALVIILVVLLSRKWSDVDWWHCNARWTVGLILCKSGIETRHLHLSAAQSQSSFNFSQGPGRRRTKESDCFQSGLNSLCS